MFPYLRAWFMVALLSGCGSPSGEQGLLRQGYFNYCDDTLTDCSSGLFPDRIAVGATFTVDYGATEGGPVIIESPIPNRLQSFSTVQGSTKFRALQAGAATLEARSVSTHLLVDTLNIDLADIGAIRVQPSSPALLADGGTSTAPLADGGTSEIVVFLSEPSPTEVCAAATASGGRYLGGALAWTWSSSNPAVVSIVPGESWDCRTLSAEAAGRATVTVAVGSVSGTADVVVKP